MRKAFFAMVFSGLLAVSASGCGGGGGGSDFANQICNKGASCADSKPTDAQLQQCKDQVDQGMKDLTSEQKSQVEQMFASCMNKDCAAFEACINDLGGTGH